MCEGMTLHVYMDIYELTVSENLFAAPPTHTHTHTHTPTHTHSQTKHPSHPMQMVLPTLYYMYKMVGGGLKGRSALMQIHSSPPENMRRKAVSLAHLQYERTPQPWSTWHDIVCITVESLPDICGHNI